MDLNTAEQMKASRWLGGRGTRFLYISIGLTIVGTLLTGQTMSQTRAETEKAAVSVETAVKLASDVRALCEGAEFRVNHEDACARAAELLGDPSGPAGGFVEIVNAAAVQP